MSFLRRQESRIDDNGFRIKSYGLLAECGITNIS